MASTFNFKFHKTSWGIFIDLTAEFVSGDPTSEKGDFDRLLLVMHDVWLDLHPGFPKPPENEQQMLVLGARLILENPAVSSSLKPGVVKLLKIDFTLTEYQPEGLACAMMGWTAREWNVPAPDIPIRYDKPKNVYFFKFPGLPEMGTHLLNGHYVME